MAAGTSGDTLPPCVPGQCSNEHGHYYRIPTSQPVIVVERVGMQYNVSIVPVSVYRVAKPEKLHFLFIEIF